jgi:hypothetical protein
MITTANSTPKTSVIYGLKSVTSVDALSDMFVVKSVGSVMIEKSIYFTGFFAGRRNKSVCSNYFLGNSMMIRRIT